MYSSEFEGLKRKNRDYFAGLFSKDQINEVKAEILQCDNDFWRAKAVAVVAKVFDDEMKQTGLRDAPRVMHEFINLLNSLLRYDFLCFFDALLKHQKRLSSV